MTEPPPYEHPSGVPTAHPVRAEALSYARIASPVQLLPMPMSVGHAVAHLVILLSVWFFAEIGVGLTMTLSPAADSQWLKMGASIMLGLLLAAACVFMTVVDRHKFVTLGWTTRELGGNIGLGVASVFVLMPLLAVLMIVLIALFPDLLADRLKAQKAIEETFPEMSVWTLIAMSIWVAVWEETVFRGFLLTRLRAITRNWWIAVPIGAALFAGPHFYQGISAMFMIFVLGLALGGLMVWRKILVPCIVFHALFDFIQLNLAQYYAEHWSDV